MAGISIPSSQPSSESRGTDEAPTAQRVTREEALRDAKALFRNRINAVLGTVSRHEEGGPFGSVVPYALDATGCPLIYVAGIAEHTRNMKLDPRVSLLVHDEVGSREDIQTKARLCVMGSAKAVESSKVEDAWARYLARIPAADGYRRTHDFSLWRIEPSRMRWIGGFGEIFWLPAEAFAVEPEADPLREGAAGIIAHMNEDHLDAAQELYLDQRGERPEHIEMVGVDQFGMDFQAGPHHRLRVDFDAPANPETIRVRVVETLRKARARISTRQTGEKVGTP